MQFGEEAEEEEGEEGDSEEEEKLSDAGGRRTPPLQVCFLFCCSEQMLKITIPNC